MKKNFLLLLLLTLLPLATWAADPTAIAGLKWTNSDQALVTDGGKDYWYAVVKAGAAKPGSAAAQKETVPTGKDVGSYDVYYVHKGGALDAAAWDAATRITVSIDPAEITVKGFAISKDWADPFVEPTKEEFKTTAGWGTVSGIAGSSDDKWDLVLGYLTYQRVDNGTDVATYGYTFIADNTPGAHDNFVIYVDDAAAKLSINQIANVVPTVTIATDWTYGDDPTGKITVENSVTPKGYGAETATFEFFDEAGTTSLGATVPTDAAKYQVIVTIPATVNYTEVSTAKIPFEIKKATLTDADLEGTGKYAAYLTAPTSTGEQTYAGAGEYLSLVTPAVINTADGVFAGAEINYRTVKDGTDVYEGPETYKVDAVGSYTVQYKIINAKNFDNFVSTAAPAKVITNTVKPAQIPTVTVGEVKTDLTYTGAAQNLIKTTPTVKGFKDEVIGGTFAYQIDGADATPAEKTNAAEYVVTFKFTSTNPNYESITSYQTVGGTGAKAKIAPAELTVTAPTPDATLSYYKGGVKDQLLLTAGATAKFGATDVDLTVTYTWKEGTTNKSATALGDVKATNAGDYVITYTAEPTNALDKQNFTLKYASDPATVTATIAPAPLDIAAQPIEVDWTGNAVVLANEHYAKGDPSDFVAGEDEDQQYAIVNTLVKLLSIEGATTEKPIPTDAGYYKFKLTKADPDPTPCNYVINTFSPDGSLQINKVASTPAAVEAADLTYTGGNLTLLTVTGEAKGGTMKYYLAASETEVAPATDSGKWVDAIPQGQEAGKYYVYSYVKGDNNHNDTAPVKTTAEIKAKSLTGMTVAFTPAEATYTGSPLTVAVSVKDGTKDLDPTTEFGVKEIKFAGATVTEIKAAGTYTYTIEGKGNYTGQITSPFTVKQAANEVNVTITGWAYGATPNKPQATVKFGKVEDVKFTYAKNEASPTFADAVPTEVGDYIVKAFLAGTADYADAFDTETFSITPVDPAIESTEEKTVVYNGADQELAEAAKSTDGTFTYAAVAAGAEAPADAAYTKDIPVALNAGKYDVYTKFTPDANHNAATVAKVTATIEKKNIGIMLNTLDESIEANIITYNGEAVPMNAKLWTIYAPSDLPGVDANLPVNDRPFSFTFPAEVKNAGDYVFTELTPVWKDEKVQNYTFTFSQAAKFTVHPKKLDKTMITLDPTSAPYKKGVKHTVAVTVADGNPSILVFGDKDAAKNDVNYVIKNGDATVANGSIEAAGTYNFVFTAQNNYEGEVIVPFTVNNKDIAALLQDADWSDKVYNGKNQAPTVVLKDKKINDKGKEEEFTLTEGTDYELKVWMPTGATTAQAVAKDQVINVAYNQQAYRFEITGKGNYSGTISKTKTITRKPLRDDEKQKDFSMPASAEYIALGQMPAITAKSEVEALVEGKDYEVWVDGAKIDTKKDKLNEAKAYAFEFKGIGNYTSSVTRTFTITKATVIVTASSYTKKYNGKNGVEGAKVVGGGDAWTYSGLKNYDGFDPALVQAAEGALTVKPVNDQTKNVGTYQLVVDPSKFSYGVEPGVNNYNFIVADEQGTLTIEKTPIVLGFDTEKKDNSGNTVPVFITKEYGVKDADFFSKNNQFVEKFVKVKAAEDDSPIAAEIAGLAYELKNGNKVVHPAGLAFSRDNADVEAVGKYTGVVTMTADGGVFSNYDVAIHSTKGNFEIAKAVLTIALKDDIEVIYDGAVPTEEVASISNDKLAVSGKQWNDDYSVIKNVKGTIVNPSEHVGSYVVKLEAEAENYTVVTLDARIIIREAPLTVTIADQTINKTNVDDVNTMLKKSKAATVKGIVGNDDIKATMVVNGVNTLNAGVYATGVKFTIANPDYQLVDEKGKALDPQVVYGKLIVLDNGYEIALNDAAAYNQAKKETHDVTFTTRSVNQDTWNVCVLPFETTPAEVSAMFGYAVVDLLNKEASDGNIHFVVTTSGVIPAGTPFVFKPTKDAAGAKTDFDQVVFEDVEVLPLADFATKELFVEGGNTYAKDAANNKFWGTFKETSFEGKRFWYMSKGDWKDASQRSVTLKSYRAYVEFDEANVAAGARIFVEEADGTITAIKGIDANGQLIAADGWYTVNGVKLNAAPTQKGTYIKDGKKVFVK